MTYYPDGNWVRTTEPPHHEMAHCFEPERAERIAACLNACEGLDNATLTDGWITRLIRAAEATAKRLEWATFAKRNLDNLIRTMQRFDGRVFTRQKILDALQKIVETNTGAGIVGGSNLTPASESPHSAPGCICLPLPEPVNECCPIHGDQEFIAPATAAGDIVTPEGKGCFARH